MVRRVEILRCPNCNSKQVGMIGSNMYYCRNCFCQFQKDAEGSLVYFIDDDGNLLSAAEARESGEAFGMKGDAEGSG